MKANSHVLHESVGDVA